MTRARFRPGSFFVDLQCHRLIQHPAVRRSRSRQNSDASAVGQVSPGNRPMLWYKARRLTTPQHSTQPINHPARCNLAYTQHTRVQLTSSEWMPAKLVAFQFSPETQSRSPTRPEHSQVHRFGQPLQCRSTWTSLTLQRSMSRPMVAIRSIDLVRSDERSWSWSGHYLAKSFPTRPAAKPENQVNSGWRVPLRCLFSFRAT